MNQERNQQVVVEIIKTPCYPNEWKIEPVGTKPDNAAWRYRRTRNEALRLATQMGYHIARVDAL